MERMMNRGQRDEEEDAGTGVQRGERGDPGGALMDRVKKEQTEERGGEGAALGQ